MPPRKAVQEEHFELPRLPVPYCPHNYQKKAIKFALEHACALLLLDPGLGKTSITYAAIKFLLKRQLISKVLIVAPLRVAHLVWPAEQEKWSDFADLRVVVLHGPKKEKLLATEADIYIINPEGLEWLLGVEKTKYQTRTGVTKTKVGVDAKRWKALGFDTLVIDECFVSGTQINTPTGLRSIEHLTPGDIVDTPAGPQPILHVVKSSAAHLLRVELSNGKEITCTPEHPFFTDLGWLPAEHLEGRRIFSALEVPMLRGNLRSEAKSLPVRKSAELLEILRSEITMAEKPRYLGAEGVSGDGGECYGAPALEQGAALERRGESEDVRFAQARWERLRGEPGWQRPRPITSRGIGPDSVTHDIYLQLRNRVGEQAARLSYELQSRFWRPGEKIGDRGGWAQPLLQQGSAGTGPQERSQVDGTWVVRVAREERRGLQDVWNLEVAECPHYFAGGALVHNCSKFKHPGTNRFKALKLVLHTFARRWGLTGSPASNGLLDLFGQAFVIDQGRSLGQFITHYRSKYFETVDKAGFVWRPRLGAEKEIYERIAPLALRMAAEDYLELPQLVVNIIKLDLPADVRPLYDQLHDDLIMKIEQGVVVAQNAASASVKCRQVSNGGIYLTPDLEITGFKLAKTQREWANLHTVKVDALADLIDELQGQPLLVAYDFEHDLDRLQIKFGQGIPYIGGGVSTKRSKELEGQWNRGELPVLFAHPQAAGHGLNLQESGCHVCWHSMTFDYELYDQFIRRVLRQGNTSKRVFVHHLIMRDTVDELMLIAVKRKAKGQQGLFDALQEIAKRRKK